MKKIISFLLVLCLAVTLGLSLSSCESAQNEMPEDTAFTRLWTHLHDDTNQGNGVAIEDTQHRMMVYLTPEEKDEGDSILVLAEFPMGTGYTGHLSFDLKNEASAYTLTYTVFETESKKMYHGATVEMDARAYTGGDYLSFSSVNNISITEEFARRQDVTFIFNNCLTVTDTFLASQKLSVKDFGFVALADRYLSEETVTSLKNEESVKTDAEEEDLGGLFSGARLAYAGEMLVLGISMVFLVLAVLWVVLIIFAKTMGNEKSSKKKEAKEESASAPAPVSTPIVASAPSAATSDDAIVAAITAAIAMTIESDPALSSQFASGFRVVSFQKKNGKTSWNH